MDDADEEPNEPNERRVVIWAVVALALFCLLTAGGLWAWFSRAESPWGWKSLVATIATLGSIVAAVFAWRAPSRETMGAGIGVMIFSLLRVGTPDAWTTASFVIVAITAVLLIPLVHAAMVLPSSRE